jgi:uncharacterized protein involved in oxidation of intracellular sulfur
MTGPIPGVEASATSQNEKLSDRIEEKTAMKLFVIITTDDGETIYNAMRLANIAENKGDEVAVFMLGRGVLFEQSGSEQFDVMGEIDKFGGDFFV